MWTPANGTWIKEFKEHDKTKLCSMIVSNKTFTDNQRKRLDFANSNKNNLDLYGIEFNRILNKEEGLNDYYFSIVMENGTYPLMYSEKITDCFASGTIPIYYGTSMIGDVFNINGIIILDESFNINDLTPDLYYSKMDAIKENYHIATSMPVAEDYIYENFIKI